MRQAVHRRSRIAAFAVLAGGLLAGCTHAVDLTPLDGGAPGIGDVAFRGGSMTVALDGKVYSGRFIPGTSPELASLSAPAFAASGAVATGRYWGSRDRAGSTGAVLAAKDGATIACRFDYDAPTSLGAGVCRGQDGRNFSLRMR